MLSKRIKIISWNIIVPLVLLFSLELIIRIAVPDIQLPGLDRKILKDSVYFSSPGLQKNSSGTSSGIIKAVNSSGFWKFYHGKSKRGKERFCFWGILQLWELGWKMIPLLPG